MGFTRRHYCPICPAKEDCPYGFFFECPDGGPRNPSHFFNIEEVDTERKELVLPIDVNHVMAIWYLFPPFSTQQFWTHNNPVWQTALFFTKKGLETWESPLFEKVEKKFWKPIFPSEYEPFLRKTNVPSFWEPFLSTSTTSAKKSAFPSPEYSDFYQHSWGYYAKVPIDQYRQLRDDGLLPKDEKVLLFREPGAMFFRPPAPTLSISAVQTVFSVAPDSVGTSVNNNNNNNNEDDRYIVVPRKAIRAAKQQLRAAREALKELDPYIRKTKTTPRDGFKSASEPPSPQTAEHTCRKCEASFRSRNALFDHIYSNTCRKSSKTQSFIITANNTPASQTAPKTSSSLTVTATRSPAPRPLPSSHGLFTPVKTRPVSDRGNGSPIEWTFNHAPPLDDDTPPFASTTVTPLPNSPVTAPDERKESSQLSTPNGFHGNKLDSFKQPSTPSTLHSCRTCNESFASRNLLFTHLHDHKHCRPDKLSKKTSPGSPAKSFKIKNTSWRSGKTIQMDFGVLGDVISKLTAVATAA